MASGVKVTENVQVPPEAITVPQVLPLTTKLVLFPPVVVGVVLVAFVAELFVTVQVDAELELVTTILPKLGPGEAHAMETTPLAESVVNTRASH